MGSRLSVNLHREGRVIALYAPPPSDTSPCLSFIFRWGGVQFTLSGKPNFEGDALAEPYVVIELAGPPRGKGRPRFSSRGGFTRVFTDKATVEYENRLKDAGIAAMQVMGLQPLDEAISIDIRAYVPVPESWSKKKRAQALAGDIMPTSAPDFDNVTKIVDGLNHHPPRFKGDKEKRPIIWKNDSQIVVSQFMKIYDARPRLSIAVYRWF